MKKIIIFEPNVTFKLLFISLFYFRMALVLIYSVYSLGIEPHFEVKLKIPEEFLGLL